MRAFYVFVLFFLFFLALNAPLATVSPANFLRICLVAVVVAAVLLPLVKALGKEVQARLSALGSFHPSQRGKLTDLRDLNGRADKKVRDI